MTTLRQVGRLGRTLGASIQASRGSLSLTRPWVCRACSRTGTEARRYTSDEGPEEHQQKGQQPFIKFIKLREWQTRESFARRHIGPDEQSTEQMLKELKPPVQSLD